MVKKTGLESLKRRENLAKGYPLKNPKTGTVTVNKTVPSTRGRRRGGTNPAKTEASSRDAEAIRERQRVERALGITRNVASKGKK